jgi:hypothetical protein
MKRIILAMAIGLGSFSVGAADTLAPDHAPGSRSPNASIELSAAQRQEILGELQARFELAATARDTGGALVPNRKFERMVMKADASNLLAASEMPTYQTMMGALQGQSLDSESMIRGIAAGGSGSIQSLGSTIADTTFTPLPNGRCRVADSRVINSPIGAAETRDIDVEDIGSYASQGGSGSTLGQGSGNCGIPSFATSLAVSVTVLPIGNDGFFKIFENGQAFSEGNTVLFTGTVGASNDVIVRSCQACVDELAVYANQPTHSVVDVIGYFMPNQATALECVTVDGTEVSAPAGSTRDAFGGTCAATYTAIGGVCQTNFNHDSSIMDEELSSNRYDCQIYNPVGAPNNQTAIAGTRCCRIPGR